MPKNDWGRHLASKAGEAKRGPGPLTRDEETPGEPHCGGGGGGVTIYWGIHDIFGILLFGGQSYRSLILVNPLVRFAWLWGDHHQVSLKNRTRLSKVPHPKP